MVITVALLAVWLVLALAGETSIGRLLHRAIVELPAAALNRVNRGHVILTVAVIGLTCITIWYEQADGLRMLSMAVPDIAAWLITLEVSAYLEVVAALMASSWVTRLKNVRSCMLAVVARLSRRRVAGDARPRCSRRRSHIAPANDDEDGAGFALAS